MASQRGMAKSFLWNGEELPLEWQMQKSPNETKLSRGYLTPRLRCSKSTLITKVQFNKPVAVGCSAWLGDGAYELRPALSSAASSECLILLLRHFCIGWRTLRPRHSARECRNGHK